MHTQPNITFTARHTYTYSEPNTTSHSFRHAALQLVFLPKALRHRLQNLACGPIDKAWTRVHVADFEGSAVGEPRVAEIAVLN